MPLGETATAPGGSVGVKASACLEEEIVETRETPTMRGRGSQLELREEQARSFGVADRLVLLWKPGNAGGGKEPDFWRVPGRDQQSGDWLCLSTPIRLGGHGKNCTCQRRWRCFRSHVRCETEPSCAGERSQSESRVREIRTHGSMSGRWKRSMVRLVRHPQTKGRETDRLHLNHRATSRLYHELTPILRGLLPELVRRLNDSPSQQF